MDVAYGGITFAFVEAESVELSLDVSQEAAIYELGQRIKKAAAEQLEVSHPENPLIPGITNTSFTGPVGTPSRRGELNPAQLFRHESIIGSQFDSRVERTTRVVRRRRPKHCRPLLDHLIQPARARPDGSVPGGIRRRPAVGT